MCLSIKTVFPCLLLFLIIKCMVWYTCLQDFFLLSWFQWTVFNCRYYFLLWTLETRANSAKPGILQHPSPIMPASTSNKCTDFAVGSWAECKAEESTLLNCPVPSAVLRLRTGITTPQEADEFPSHGLILLDVPVMQHCLSKARLAQLHQDILPSHCATPLTIPSAFTTCLHISPAQQANQSMGHAKLFHHTLTTLYLFTLYPDDQCKSRSQLLPPKS